MRKNEKKRKLSTCAVRRMDFSTQITKGSGRPPWRIGSVLAFHALIPSSILGADPPLSVSKTLLLGSVAGPVIQVTGGRAGSVDAVQNAKNSVR